MSYVKAPNGVVETFPYSIGQLRKDNPNTSFPKNPPDSVLAEWDVYPVTRADEPVYDKETHYSEWATQPVLVGQDWVLQVNVIARPIADVEELTRGRIHQKKEEKLNGGITVDLGVGLVPIATDKDSRDDIAAVKQSDKASRRKKLKNGMKVTLTKQMTDALFDAVDNHVAVCDERECELDDMVDAVMSDFAGSVITEEQAVAALKNIIDTGLEVGWSS